MSRKTTVQPCTGQRAAQRCIRLMQRMRVVMVILLLVCAGSLSLSSDKLQALDITSFYGGLVPGQEMLLLEDAEGRLNVDEARLQLQAAGQPWVAYTNFC